MYATLIIRNHELKSWMLQKPLAFLNKLKTSCIKITARSQAPNPQTQKSLENQSC
jgi:hypothetical protein